MIPVFQWKITLVLMRKFSKGLSKKKKGNMFTAKMTKTLEISDKDLNHKS